MLKHQDAPPADAPNRDSPPRHEANYAATDTLHIPNKSNCLENMAEAHRRYEQNSAPSPPSDPFQDLGNSFPNGMSMGGNDMGVENIALGWDMMSLGVEEALPPPEVQEALNDIFFECVYRTIPIIHKGRYLASLHLPPNLRPPIALRYAIWTLAASVSDDYFKLQTHFYKMARKYAEEQELKGHGEHIIAVSTSQTWIMIAEYEFKLMYFPRAWLSTGRAVRLVQMMGLHRLDGSGLDVKQCLQPPKDWIEREERRRTFWMAFCVDRYASIGTGWPMTIEEKDIMTNLPGTEEAFEQGRPGKPLTLKDAMTADGARHLSPIAGIILMACLFGRNLIHLHRPDGDERDDDLNGSFWRRHRHMDNILLNIALSLPNHFKLPMGINDPNVVFTNMNIHASTICLHQAAIFKAEKHNMPSVTNDSKNRCINAAAEIATIMRMIAHTDLSRMDPFMSFCLYIAARVFVQYLKQKPDDEQMQSSLRFLLTAMGHIKKKHPLTESFLVQLDVDLKASGIDESTLGTCSDGHAMPQPVPGLPSDAECPMGCGQKSAYLNNDSKMQFFGHCPLQKSMDEIDQQRKKEKVQHEANYVATVTSLSHSQDSVIEVTSSTEHSPATSSMDTFDSSSMTPGSSNMSQSTHNTPDMLLRTEPWSPQMEPPLPNMFSFENTGFTPLPQENSQPSPPKHLFNPASPSKEPHASSTFWIPEIADDMTANMGMYSELFNNNQYAGWK